MKLRMAVPSHEMLTKSQPKNLTNTVQIMSERLQLTLTIHIHHDYVNIGQRLPYEFYLRGPGSSLAFLQTNEETSFKRGGEERRLRLKLQSKIWICGDIYLSKVSRTAGFSQGVHDTRRS
ncbi:hypothetical protein SUGI_0973730 [Cryptomeria japonica]|nr:hypothetical protein SUGI_0973730 [Cryptomeria japonica]